MKIYRDWSPDISYQLATLWGKASSNNVISVVSVWVTLFLFNPWLSIPYRFWSPKRLHPYTINQDSLGWLCHYGSTFISSHTSQMGHREYDYQHTYFQTHWYHWFRQKSPNDIWIIRSNENYHLTVKSLGALHVWLWWQDSIIQQWWLHMA